MAVTKDESSLYSVARMVVFTAAGIEDWPTLPKAQVAARLAQRIADELA